MRKENRLPNVKIKLKIKSIFLTQKSIDNPKIVWYTVFTTNEREEHKMKKNIRIGKSYYTAIDELEEQIKARNERLDKLITELKKELKLNEEKG